MRINADDREFSDFNAVDGSSARIAMWHIAESRKPLEKSQRWL
jgi:hypothetical protein